MAKHKYRIASQEGVDKFGGELGDVQELDLDAQAKTAMVAAGWIEEADDKPKEK